MEKQVKNKETKATEGEKHKEKAHEKKANPEEVIKDLREQVDTLKDKLLRQMAETENIRTRSAKMVDEAREYAIFSFAKDLVSVMDNLTRALEHAPENLDQDAKNVIEGIKMTQKELDSVFAKNALQSIKPKSGDKFDYNLHHAISQVATNEHKAGAVVGTMQVGYKIKDRLIRPAAVTVAKES